MLAPLTNIGLHISGTGQQLRGAGELAQRNVREPLASEPGRGVAPGRVHHGQVGADQPVQQGAGPAVTPPGVAVQSQTVQPRHALHRPGLDLRERNIQPSF